MEEETKPLFPMDSCNGLPILTYFDKEAFTSSVNYKPKPGEVVIVTYPKCGTTWMHHIVLLILRKGQLSNDPLDLYLGCPCIDMTGTDNIDFMSRTTAIKTHLPFRILKLASEAKYIYVTRNPFDCCVSFYYHLSTMPGVESFTFDEFFESFIKGEVPYGDYFDHVLDAYELRNNKNVYFTTYEAIKKDHKGEVLRIAKFIGEEYENAIQENSKVLDDIVYYSSFDYMKKHVNDTISGFFKEDIISGTSLPSGLKIMLENLMERENKGRHTGTQLVRKGVIGDWKNHFNSEQKTRLQNIITLRTAGSDIMNLWKDTF